VEKDSGLIEPFTQTLLREIRQVAEISGELGLRIIAVYIGGGTPTALPPDALEAVMRALETSFDLSFVREYTVEAGRPDTVSQQKLGIIGSLGAGRICINPQSMSGKVLESIGRRHTPEDALGAVRLVKQTGAALNIDIIAGLPGDTIEGFCETLDTVLALKPENITVHTLSLKKGSRIMLEGTPIPGGAEVAGMLGYASNRLRGSAYKPYYLYRQKFTSGGFENTGWCLSGYEGVYNICMMEELCTVLALGGGGVTKLVSPGGRIERVFNAKYPREYVLHTEKFPDKIGKIKNFYEAEGHYALPILC
jgi:oxygen-independent coproporphyrinogen-3 oxidase